MIKTENNNILKFIVSVVSPLVIGFLGSLVTTAAIPTWYSTLEKSSLNPPSSVFGPVWTTLYVLMGLALFLVWKQGIKNENVKRSMIWFVLQIILNLGWSLVFFGFRNPGWALVVIVILWISILLTIVRFAKVSKLAAGLLMPYILWVTFAAYLNYAVWMLN